MKDKGGQIMRTVNIIGYKNPKNNLVSIITCGTTDINKGEMFKTVECGCSGTFRACRVYYNKYYNESTILCKKIK